MYEKFLGDLLCHVATWSSHVATSNFHPSATSRRGFSRRDVDFHVATSNFHPSATSRRGFSRRDVILTLLCHVATCTLTSRRQIVRLSVTSRRGILTSRRGLLTSRRHFYTSRRHLVTYSVTSRREPSRRDVNPHVAT